MSEAPPREAATPPPAPAADPLAALRDAAAFPFWHEIDLRYGDQDPNRHINNVALCQYMEEARVNLRAALFSAEALAEPAAFVIASFRIRFLAPILYPGRVRAGTLATRLGRTSYSLGHGLFFQGELAAAGRTVTVLCDPESGRPTAIPAAIADALTSVLTDSQQIAAAIETV